MTDDDDDRVKEHLTPEQKIENEATFLAWEKISAMPEGKRVILDVLSIAGIYQDTFQGNHEATNYVAGRQSVGRVVIKRLEEVDLTLYARLLLAQADFKMMAQAVAKAQGEPAPGTTATTQENDDADIDIR